MGALASAAGVKNYGTRGPPRAPGWRRLPRGRAPWARARPAARARAAAPRRRSPRARPLGRLAARAWPRGAGPRMPPRPRRLSARGASRHAHQPALTGQSATHINPCLPAALRAGRPAERQAAQAACTHWEQVMSHVACSKHGRGSTPREAFVGGHCRDRLAGRG